jgi:hypothetical protein
MNHHGCQIQQQNMVSDIKGQNGTNTQNFEFY